MQERLNGYQWATKAIIPSLPRVQYTVLGSVDAKVVFCHGQEYQPLPACYGAIEREQQDVFTTALLQNIWRSLLQMTDEKLIFTAEIELNDILYCPIWNNVIIMTPIKREEFELHSVIRRRNTANITAALYRFMNGTLMPAHRNDIVSSVNHLLFDMHHCDIDFDDYYNFTPEWLARQYHRNLAGPPTVIHVVNNTPPASPPTTPLRPIGRGRGIRPNQTPTPRRSMRLRNRNHESGLNLNDLYPLSDVSSSPDSITRRWENRSTSSSSLPDIHQSAIQALFSDGEDDGDIDE
jgi:hypothetical protein